MRLRNSNSIDPHSNPYYSLNYEKRCEFRYSESSLERGYLHDTRNKKTKRNRRDIRWTTWNHTQNNHSSWDPFFLVDGVRCTKRHVYNAHNFKTRLGKFLEKKCI